jgi:hypothetical protein
MRGERCGVDAVQRRAGISGFGIAGSDQPTALSATQAKRIIWLYMAGGMTHLDTFDHKPKLAELHGEPMPESITKGQQIAQLQGRELKCFGPQHPFRQWGQSGQSISEIWPLLAEKCADDLCIVRSLHTDAINHDPAHTFMNTGTMNPGRPAMGSWLLYGLGAESESLPGFVVMVSTGKFGQKQPIAARQWHSGFLPGQFQGVEFRGTGDPVLYVGHPAGSHGQATAGCRGCRSEAERHRQSASGGPGNCHPHQPVRAGVSHAVECARADERRR